MCCSAIWSPESQVKYNQFRIWYSICDLQFRKVGRTSMPKRTGQIIFLDRFDLANRAAS